MTNWLAALPNMQPYADPMYFGYLILGLIPIVIGLFFGRRFQIYEAVFSFVFILLMFAGPKWPQFYALVGYIIWQTALVQWYQYYRRNKDGNWTFYIMVALAILPLVIVKLHPVFNQGKASIIGFLGISYLTFKSVGMLMEMRDGVLKHAKVWSTLRFLLFMPTLSSGPIDRYSRFEKDYENAPSRSEYVDYVQSAVWNIMLGFFYKFIVAYMIQTFLLTRFQMSAMAHGGFFNLPTIGVMYSYGFYLFFDFAGYSLFAIAISKLMGINTPINFNKPFMAKNMKDFWNRWHMTLSFWFRDYVFMRLVLVLTRNKVFKNRNVTSSVAYLVDMLVMGFWHGVTWWYILYGFLHAMGLIVNDWWLRQKKQKNLARKKAGLAPLPSNWFTQGVAIFITFNFTMFTFLIFSGFLNRLWFH
ncbi:membrane protein involved in D-alanine export [Weissella uvarum]|uniref:D-alanyl-lipoteichoic acid biosynthesis protein DltB n=1 Tax=Weissella uvarum TaxID=1479233 RepID=UPI00195F6781|nr:D-alanyl-lipoteichoic acid biosynthesis protein DltB [Weissella uvarum]MBM7616596.1 membrane protein involved in D-alanine export [Weissella uvarum]MCM0594945.1 D-alanyl-lipoteichoic acid biosynthesis protein DltB [Weissella uvarum]